MASHPTDGVREDAFVSNGNSTALLAGATDGIGIAGADAFEWPPAGARVVRTDENHNLSPWELDRERHIQTLGAFMSEDEPPHVALRQRLVADPDAPRPEPASAAARSNPGPGLFTGLRQQMTGIAALRPRGVWLTILVLGTAAAVEGVFIVSTWTVRPAAAAVPAASVTQRPADPAPQGERVAAPAVENDATASLSFAASGTRTAEPAPRGPQEPPTRARLVIRSDPAGAQVSVDGRAQGVAPVTLSSVAPGDHTIILKQNGAEIRHTAHVDPGATVSIVVPLVAAASGWVAVASPVEVDVFEDGALVGTSRSRQIMLSAGPHRLEFVNDDLEYHNVQQVNVSGGQVERVVVTVPHTTLQLNALPWAEVWVDGISVGETPIGNLSFPIGRHEFVFRHPQLGEKTIVATLKAGAPARVTADLRRQGQ